MGSNFCEGLSSKNDVQTQKKNFKTEINSEILSSQMIENCFRKMLIFIQNFFWVNLSTKTKSAPKINKIGTGRFLPCLPYLRTLIKCFSKFNCILKVQERASY